MPYSWPEDTDFALWELNVFDRGCLVCGRMMHVCDHRYRHFHTLEGPVELVCKLDHCPDPTCPGHFKTKSPELEITIAPPKMAIGWDVLCWIGHRRCSRHWSVPQIQGELQDTHGIRLSAGSLERYIRYYQVMLAARQQDPENLRREYEFVEEIILTIDGLQPGLAGEDPRRAKWCQFYFPRGSPGKIPGELNGVSSIYRGSPGKVPSVLNGVSSIYRSRGGFAVSALAVCFQTDDRIPHVQPASGPERLRIAFEGVVDPVLGVRNKLFRALRTSRRLFAIARIMQSPG